jgi:hypothetical protein
MSQQQNDLSMDHSDATWRLNIRLITLYDTIKQAQLLQAVPVRGDAEHPVAGAMIRI